MTRRGKAEQALGICLVASAIGGLFGAVVLVFSAPALAEFALRFSRYEYFWLACLGLTCAVFISTGSPVKGVVSLLIGLFIATIGIDVTAGYPRFTFGNVELIGGVSFIPAMIGMFAVSEVLRYAIATDAAARGAAPGDRATCSAASAACSGATAQHAARQRASASMIGILPGAGADIAAWITYAVAKRFSKEPEKFGTGHVEGMVDAGAANNAALGGAWVPAHGVRHPGRFDHRHRHRRALHEGHEPRPDDLPARSPS